MRSLAEWVLALGFVGSVIWLGLPVLHSLAPLPAGMVTLVESPLPALPAGVPTGAESVPFFMLDNGLVVKVGMEEEALRAPEYERYAAGRPLFEPGVLGERAVMPFRAGPSRFWLVLDRTGPERNREVTAIYLR